MYLPFDAVASAMIAKPPSASFGSLESSALSASRYKPGPVSSAAPPAPSSPASGRAPATLDAPPLPPSPLAPACPAAGCVIGCQAPTDVTLDSQPPATAPTAP